MSNERMGLALRILGVLAEVEVPGLTRGEIRTKLGVPADTEVTARIRELRNYASYGQFDVRVAQVGRKEFTYWLVPAERERAKQFLAQWRAA